MSWGTYVTDLWTHYACHLFDFVDVVLEIMIKVLAEKWKRFIATALA